ncbi:ABC transporter substrate-binding protein [Enterovibrio sp. ZSDZ42]|uniref:ABC transporter substrate-binding protein n=1 Tax=Enterovibrio gelatinilyticus TaxID=2899819 RepID=A0ABT5QYE7_9GAMM|nr:ABC transporter substrate-binding protein [Enterovibrio sp. ZSDZ42]MDD1793042.1 ABC transporter substrate-binding protein [Enterovibrio sp. ZSDZ42]
MNYLSIAAACALSVSSVSIAADLSNWEQIEKDANGQTVYFNAWGGSQEINAYLRWAGDTLNERYGVTLEHVKVSDIAETVNRLVAEKAAGKIEGGSVDMVWINGENFKSMKSNGLLFGPFAEQLPNWSIVDKSLPVTADFTEPTNGLEAPWGVGQLVFIHDEKTLANPPRSFVEMLSLAKANPGKIAYPKPPQFHGTSFLKAALLELATDSDPLYVPVDEARFGEITAPLWAYLDELHPVAWRNGKQFPAGSAETMQLLDDSELLLAITFNPNAAETAVKNGTLAPSAKTFAFDKGALSNIHYMGVPWNANAKEGALVAINFLMSEEAQARKANSDVWGDPAVVTLSSVGSKPLFKSQPEPHPSWQVALEKAWLERYGQ